MATGRQTFVTVLFCSLCCVTFAVILRTTGKDVWVNEFEPIELTCLIESISTNNPRIEWKKVKNGVPSYVYFQKKPTGDLENRAILQGAASLLILNASRIDTALYRCEVAAIDDQKDFDEIRINLNVRVKPAVPRCIVPKSVITGSSPELLCMENEGYPPSKYFWFHNNKELPEDPKVSIHFMNSSYVMNFQSGSLKFTSVRKEDAGQYHCQARNDADYETCAAQHMEVYDLDIGMLILKILAGVIGIILLAWGVCMARRRGYCSCRKNTENDYKVPEYDRKDCVTADEGHFRHKSSFVI